MVADLATASGLLLGEHRQTFWRPLRRSSFEPIVRRADGLQTDDLAPDDPYVQSASDCRWRERSVAHDLQNDDAGGVLPLRHQVVKHVRLDENARGKARPVLPARTLQRAHRARAQTTRTIHLHTTSFIP